MTTSYGNIIALAKEDLDLTGTTQYDSFFETKIDQGIERIGLLTSMPVKQCPIEVYGGKIKLPPGFIEFIALDMGGGEPVMTDFAYFKDAGCSCDGTVDYRNSMDIQEGWLVIRDPNKYLDGAKGCMAFRGRRVDEHGRGVVEKVMEECLMYFLSWQYMRRKKKIYKQWQIEDSRIQFVNRKIAINADANARHAREHQRELSAVFNAWPFSVNTY